ncbi:MAG: ATP-binding protein, partial [Prochlorotrichaceae cyanobacterium]
ILAGDLSLDLFAAKLRLVVEGNAPQTYQQPEKFFANTFETNGLKCLIEEVFGRLTGIDVGSPIIRLETSFGGGKTHDELALWHIAKKGREIQGLDRFVDNLEKIPACPIQVAAVDGRDIDPESGTYHPETGITTYTLWGEIAYQIGGIDGYQLLRGSDQSGISPGTSVLERLITDQPTLIILDEVARYLRAAKAKMIGQSTLSEQVVAFLFSLMDLAASCNNLVFVYSLASASDTFAQETEDIRDKLAQDIFSAPSDSAPESTDLQELRRASARQERILSPSSDVEVYNIVKQRMFSSISEQAAQRAADEYVGAYRASRMDLPDGCKDASYGQAIAQSYPFHPELFNLLTKKIASIPEFQRTRGALRLFARVVRYLWQEQGSKPEGPRLPMTMVHPHHLPIGVEQEITSDLTSRLQRPSMDLPIKADIYNPDARQAHAQVQDQDWLAAAKPPFSSWVSRTIFLHSLTQGISSGLRRSELNLSLLMPNVEIGFVDQALERLTKVAWYLDFDPVTTIARFKEEPSINKIIAEEKEQIGLTEAKDELRKRRDSIFATKFFDRISGPEGPHEVDDRSDTIALCLIDFNEATLNTSTDGTPPLVEQIFNNTGEAGRFRIFRNRLLFLLANKQELDRAIDLTREYRAVQAILRSPNRLDDLSESQQRNLKQKEGELDLAVRIALTNAYRHLFYPSQDPIKAPKGLMHYPLPAQDSSTIKGKNNQQDVILKALKDCSKIRPDEAQPFAPAYILQKVWPSGLDQWTTKALREAFAKDLNLNILLDAEVSKLRDTIRQGLLDGQWDLRMGNQIFIKTTAQPLTPPGTIEFSERMELYRRGILKPPEPKDIELSAQVLPSGGIEQMVRVRWRAKGAVSVSLYQGNELLGDQFKPSDEYEGKITTSTPFRVVADYGAEGTEEKATTAVIYAPGAPPTPKGNDQTATPLFKPTEFNLQGSPTKVFNDLADQVNDHQVKSIAVLEIAVEQIMDYRKLCTTIPLLQRFQPQVEQYVRIQTGQQFLSLEYQGDLRGFQTFTTPLNGLLNHPEVQGSTMLKVRFEFEPAIATTGSPLSEIQGALQRNPVERLDLFVRVGY